MDNLIGNANLIELIWTISAAVGVVVTGFNITNGVLNYLSMGGLRNGRKRIAFGNIRRDSLREVIQITQLVIGWTALLDPTPAKPEALVFVALLMPSTVLLTISTIFDAIDNHYVLDHVESKE